MLELFEGGSKAPTAGFSSFQTLPPIVFSQSFIIPSAVTSMAVTATEHGITHKGVLLALVSGHVLSLHERFLDPRRPTSGPPVEGLVPYTPQLPVDPRAFINYHQTLRRVEAIATSPSSLESTSLVFVHGLDLFFNQASPSNKFDVLNDDFNYLGLSLSMVALAVATVLCAKVNAAKVLSAAWE